MGNSTGLQQFDEAGSLTTGTFIPSSTYVSGSLSQAKGSPAFVNPLVGDAGGNGVCDISSQPQFVETGSTAPSIHLCEELLLSQLVQLLGQRPRHVLLLSDLGALLPAQLRHGVKEKGGLRSWLQKYPELFQVTGLPGKESVTLLFGTPGADGGSNGVVLGPDCSAVPGNASSASRDQQTAADLEQKRREDEENESAVQLRGLPYRATVADIKAFLGRHVNNLQGESAVQLVLNRDGRASGFARVQFDSPDAAREARDELHKCMMKTGNSMNSGAGATGGGADGSGAGDRYVELFLFSERPNKLRFKKAQQGDAAANLNEEELACSGITKEQVVMECREHMSSPGKGQLLLSMLGVALSQGGRLYLKKTDQGLKHFLSQYPEEFTVEGLKGREWVSYLPVLEKGGDNSDLPADFTDKTGQSDSPVDVPETDAYTSDRVLFPEKVATTPSASKYGNRGTPAGGRAGTNEFGCSTGNISELRTRWEDPAVIPQSPQAQLPSTPVIAAPTPSPWGTPEGYASLLGDRHQSSGNRGTPAGGRAGTNEFGCSTGNISELRTRWEDPAVIPQSPQAQLPSTPAVIAAPTPSPWGTPEVFDSLLGDRHQSSGGFDGRFGGGTDYFGTGAMYSKGEPSLQSSGEWGGASSYWQPGGGLPATWDVIAALNAAASGCQPSAAVSQMSPQHVQAVHTEQFVAPQPAAESYVAIRLRGLPFSATEQDVLAFFAKHEVVECIAEESKAVRLIPKANGKPSGQASVLLQSKEDMATAIQALNGQWISSRYIEVFADCGDGPDVSKDSVGIEPSNPGLVGMPSDLTPGRHGLLGCSTGSGFGMLGDPAGLSALGGSSAPSHSQSTDWASLLQMPGQALHTEQKHLQPGSFAEQDFNTVKQTDGNSWEALFDLLKPDTTRQTGVEEIEGLAPKFYSNPSTSVSIGRDHSASQVGVRLPQETASIASQNINV
eukprot:TRINITY_DN2704_c0_g1_i2.p1 TRINITY_DN2704_c0_g1~~TRINITY_DN2704_c0_g1_i2.p1  ORF type:complete len:982 (+),score=159.59 TRINITY_DN2704_c0_g1_i2:84-2948(+)